jgi:tetratricopeptide (TPR) repeat protein
MSASRFSIALSAFATGALVAGTATWLFQEGSSNTALAQGDTALLPALSLSETEDTGSSTASQPDTTAADSQQASAERAPTETLETRSALGSGSAFGDSPADMQASLDSAIARLYEKNPERFLDMLINQFIEDGDPRSALELLKQSDSTNGYHFERVGQALQKSGDLAGAIEAYSKGLRLDPMGSDSLGPLMELDPSTALLVVREGLAWQPPPGNPQMRTRLAEALLAAGQDEEARELVEELRESGFRADSLSRLFARVNPDAAEAELRASVDKAQGSKKVGPLQKLAAMLESSGREEEARAIIDQILELNPRNGRARRMLMEADPAAAVEFLAERTTAEPNNSGLWSDYGKMLLAQGRKVDAVEAWEKAVSLSGHQRSVRMLLEHSPDTVWGHLETYTQNSRDDERWGDLGDLYWEHGRHDDARRAWETAWELDASDSEWYGNLQALQVGRDPLD